MRLINAKRFLETGKALFRDVGDNDDVPYAIISHRWGEDEISLKDIELGSSDLRRKEGYFKVKNACKVAMEDRLNYIWIDTCKYCGTALLIHFEKRMHVRDTYLGSMRRLYRQVQQ